MRLDVVSVLLASLEGLVSELEDKALVVLPVSVVVVDETSEGEKKPLELV